MISAKSALLIFPLTGRPPARSPRGMPGVRSKSETASGIFFQHCLQNIKSLKRALISNGKRQEKGCRHDAPGKSCKHSQIR